MPKCLECGFESQRLQWTHFKYKCTGRFKTIPEYRAEYPDSVLVDPELAKKNRATLENMVRKYGEKKGKQKWDQYRQKQAETNSFAYKQKTHNWSREQFDEYNKSRAVTLDNLISRHGADRGIDIWQQYVERQRYTNTLEYFVEKFGNAGKKRWEAYNTAKASATDVYAIAKRFNVSIEDAVEILSTRLSNNKFYSRAEIEFVELLEANTGTIKHTAKTKQFSMWNNSTNKINFFDITDSAKKKIIEFNGDFWHCNPKTYSPNYISPFTGLTAAEIWEQDNQKIKLATNRGFQVKIVWYSDFVKNKKLTIDKAVKWWNQT